VQVGVDEPGDDDAPGQIDDGGPGGVDIVTDGGDGVVIVEDVDVLGVGSASGHGDHPGAAQQCAGHWGALSGADCPAGGVRAATAEWVAVSMSWVAMLAMYPSGRTTSNASPSMP
jgi:hypothetical protein